MAKGKNRSIIANLVPNSFEVSINGREVRIAASKEENTILNMITAGQMRALLQEHVKKYQDTESTLTPKELRDLAAAARDIATFSAEVYVSSEPMVAVASSKEPESDIDFEAILTKEDGKQDKNAPETNDSESAASASEPDSDKS